MSECRICFNTVKDYLVSPCRCTGSIKHIHQTCLMKWVKEKYPNELFELLKNPKSQNSKLQCELCKYEFRSKTRYLNAFEILRKIQTSHLTFSILLNIPVIVFLIYKCKNMLRHLFSLIFNHMLGNYGRKEEHRRTFTIFKTIVVALVRLAPISMVVTVLPLLLHGTAQLIQELWLEFKDLKFEEFVLKEL